MLFREERNGTVAVCLASSFRAFRFGAEFGIGDERRTDTLFSIDSKERTVSGHSRLLRAWEKNGEGRPQQEKPPNREAKLHRSGSEATKKGEPVCEFHIVRQRAFQLRDPNMFEEKLSVAAQSNPSRFLDERINGELLLTGTLQRNRTLQCRESHPSSDLI